MNTTERFRRYQELQTYVGWTDADAERVASVATIVDPVLPALVEDFYAEIARHADAQRVITGGTAQIARLKTTLIGWLRELFSGRYDAEYVQRRWQIGYRHVEIGLNQVYTNTALSRLRRGLGTTLAERLKDELARLIAVRQSLDTLIDLDLAIIEDAYQEEYLARQQRVERLATIGRVAGGVAHELRNPLNVVKTSIYYLLNARNATPEKIGDHLQRIGRQVEVADDIISALSDFAKLPVPERRPTDLSRCIDEVLLAETLPPHVNANVSFEASLPPVLVDAKQLRIALGNLIRNACDAMPDGGQLGIRGTCDNGKVNLAVSDTGVGIPRDHLRQIMEPFFSTKARGIGLGLALTRSILDKNKGELSVTSDVGRGSTFTVSLHPAPE
jgi:signal transduction histidine kinase